MMPKNFRLVFNLSKNVIALVVKEKLKLLKKNTTFLIKKKLKLPPTHSNKTHRKKKIKNI